MWLEGVSRAEYQRILGRFKRSQGRFKRYQGRFRGSRVFQRFSLRSRGSQGVLECLGGVSWGLIVDSGALIRLQVDPGVSGVFQEVSMALSTFQKIPSPEGFRESQVILEGLKCFSRGSQAASAGPGILRCVYRGLNEYQEVPEANQKVSVEF